MHEEYEQRVGRPLEEADQRVSQASADLEKRFTDYLAKSAAHADLVNETRTRHEWDTLLNFTLARHEEIQGGIWTARDGFVAFAFPTYEGDLAKKDLPIAEMDRIAALNRECLTANKLVARRLERGHQTLLLRCVPLSYGSGKIALCTLLSEPIADGGARATLTYGVLLLLALPLFSGALILGALFHLSRSLQRIVQNLSVASGEDFTPLPPCGHRELDRLVQAFNEILQRCKNSRRKTTPLA